MKSYIFIIICLKINKTKTLKKPDKIPAHQTKPILKPDLSFCLISFVFQGDAQSILLPSWGDSFLQERSIYTDHLSACMKFIHQLQSNSRVLNNFSKTQNNKK